MSKLNREGRVSIIVQVYNGEREISKCIERISKQTYRDIELVVVNDGSTDNTLEKIRAIPSIDIVTYPFNKGKGYAFLTGLEIATGDYIILLDSDLQIRPYELPTFLNIMQIYRADVVIGNKRHPYSYTNYNFTRSIISNTYNLMCRKMFGIDLRDTQCGFKLFKTSAINKVKDKIKSKRFAFDIEILIALRENRIRVADAPVLVERQYSSGSINIKNIWDTFIDTVMVWIRKKEGYYGQE